MGMTYEKCGPCHGTGRIGAEVFPADQLAKVNPPSDPFRCPCCKGEKYVPTAITVAQIEALVRRYNDDCAAWAKQSRAVREELRITPDA